MIQFQNSNRREQEGGRQQQGNNEDDASKICGELNGRLGSRVPIVNFGGQ
jgi:hypothetical protein